MNTDVIPSSWFVMRVTYQREIKAAKLLDEMGVENYVPTCRVKKRNADGIAIGWATEPLIHNYIFIHDAYKKILELKQGKLSFLRFMMGKDDHTGEKTPLVVPHKQMEDFIRITKSRKVVVLDPSVDIRKGQKVRVLTGNFEGVEGTLIRIPGKNKKGVVVRIEGVAAVATVELSISDVEKIEEPKTLKKK